MTKTKQIPQTRSSEGQLGATMDRTTYYQERLINHRAVKDL